MDLHSRLKEIMIELISGEFLESVEKWARYDGEEFWIGDMDVSVKNLGTFVEVKESPKLLFGTKENPKFEVSKTETTTYETVYDVTLIKNNARCTDNDKIVVIAERYSDYFDKLEKEKRPCKLYIHSIDEDYNDHKADNSKYTKHPTFERLKEDFEKGNYKPYRSLLSEFCGQYSLSTYNDNSDRIFSLSAIAGDLNWLNFDEESKDRCNHIEVPSRNGNIYDTDRAELLRKNKETTD